MLRRVAQHCENCIPRAFSLPRLAGRCIMLRSRWYQSGIKNALPPRRLGPPNQPSCISVRSCIVTYRLAAHRASGALLYWSFWQGERGKELPRCTPTHLPPRLPSMLTCALPILKACSPSCQRPWHHTTWRRIARRATARRRPTWRGTSVGS